MNFFCVFSTCFVPWYKKPKSLKNDFFRAYADAKLPSNYLTSIVGINKIIPAFAYARKKSFFGFLAFCTMVRNFYQNTDISYCKLEINYFYYSKFSKYFDLSWTFLFESLTFSFLSKIIYSILHHSLYYPQKNKNP